MAANDRMLLGAREAIDETLSWEGAAKLMVAGFDRVEESLLDDDFMVASADQYVGVAGAGLWRAGRRPRREQPPRRIPRGRARARRL